MIISTRMLNRHGNITHYCLAPLLILNYLEINPAVLTAAFVFYMGLDESNVYEKLICKLNILGILFTNLKVLLVFGPWEVIWGRECIQDIGVNLDEIPILFPLPSLASLKWEGA